MHAPLSSSAFFLRALCDSALKRCPIGKAMSLRTLGPLSALLPGRPPHSEQSTEPAINLTCIDACPFVILRVLPPRPLRLCVEAVPHREGDVPPHSRPPQRSTPGTTTAL